MHPTPPDELRSPREPRAATSRDALLIILFLTVIGTPSVLMLTSSTADAHADEKRELAGLPAWSADPLKLVALPRQFKGYVSDHFGLRSFLIRAHSMFTVGCLNVSESSKALVGEDGWLFLTEAIAAQREAPLSEDELRRWREVLEARREWLAERGARFLFVIIPDKCSVYPEYLPPSYQRVPVHSRIDQLVAYMREHSDVSVLDVRASLLEAKPRGRLYARTDTHYNDLGAYVTYRSILERLAAWFPDAKPVDVDHFNLVEEETPGGDLAVLLNVRDWMREMDARLVPRERRRPVTTGVVRRGSVVTREGGQVPRAVIFHDSFGVRLRPFLTEHFRRAVFSWRNGTLDTELVEAERPNVVIQQIVARSVRRVPLHDSRITDAATSPSRPGSDLSR